jgi:ketosteroid isomerase-like protein
VQERLQELLDHHDIRTALAEYCHALDRCDEPGVASAYAQESWDEHGMFEGTGEDFAKFIMPGMIQNKAASHMLGQSLIRVDGDSAGAESYFLAVICTHSPNGPDQPAMAHQLGGRYVDRLVREADGKWRIKHRIVVRDWSISLPIEYDLVAGAGMAMAKRNNSDPSFAALGITHSGIPQVP